MKCLSILFFILPGFALMAQTPVVVLSPSASDSEKHAAAQLQFYIGQMTGQKVPVATSLSFGKNKPVVFVGNSPSANAFGFKVPEGLAEDAYFMEGKQGAFAIGGGGEMGAEYAAYSLLELLGCRKFSPRDSLIPFVKKLQLPDYQAKIESPSFPYRELWYEPAFDESWARWHKLKTNPKKNEEWGMFVHTFDKLCPKEQYFAAHPEYFAFNGAQRSPGQLCLSNDTVLQIVIASLREQIRQKPLAKYWSVSQNDNYDYCKCARCAATDLKYGSPAASLLLFVNRVAAAFPDKTISTLAYQYTRQAPKGLKPALNVNICLCSIECNRGQSIEEGCPDFARDVREWSALTQNLMIWDYVVQFRSYLGPFPNWHTLQPNLQFFQQNGVKMMFEQGSGHDRSEFSDMRAYLLAKLMWNPKANMDSILNDFGNGYYGVNRVGVWNYIHSHTERLKKHGNHLWIYDVPQHEPFVQDSFMERMVTFDRDLPQPSDSTMLRRLEPVVVVELFSFLENLKCVPLTGSDPYANMARMLFGLDKAGIKDALHQFELSCARSGLKHLNENGYTPAQYVKDYQDYLTRTGNVWTSLSQSVTLEAPAAAQYAKGKPEVLIDRLVGETDYRYNWLGFQGENLKAVVQVSDSLPVACSTIEISFLQDQASWVFYPEKVIFEISSDGEHFQTIHEESIEIQADGKKAFRTVKANFPPTAVQSVRLTAVNQKNCPAWHTCNGNPSWIFADEILVR